MSAEDWKEFWKVFEACRRALIDACGDYDEDDE